MSTQSPDTRPPTLPQASYGLKDAAELVARSTKTILRWCQDDMFPGAEKVPGPKGDEWSIPSEDLAAVIVEKNLTIHLDQTLSTQPTTQEDALVQALETIGELRQKVGHLSGQTEQLERTNMRLASDVDHLRAEYERTQNELVESERQRGTLEGEIKRVQQERDQTSRDRDSLDQKYLELQKSNAESLSALSDDLETSRTETQETVGELDELATKLAVAESSMGWWTRRRYRSR